MALDDQALAKKLHDALGQKKDGQGKPTQISSMTKAYAAGIVACLKAAIVTNAPGTIVGVTAPGAPLSGGAGTGGLMVVLPAAMLAKTLVGIPPKAIPNMQKENTAIIQYIGTGLVAFSSITGTCTNSPTSPGPLTLGAGQNGMITGLTGAGALAAVGAVGIVGPDALKHYTALINYIVSEAKVTYPSGGIVGACPPGGGPLTAGAGIGGTIA